MFRPPRQTLIALACLGACVAPARATAFFDDLLRIEGFGTLGAFSSNLASSSTPPSAISSTPPQVRADIRQSHGATDHHVIWDADTLLAVQATVNPSGPIKGVLQLMSKQDVNASQRPQVEWAYGSWDVSSRLGVRAGRVVAPIFSMSDTRQIAYTQTAVRPPTAVYQIDPFTHLDGATFLWQDKAGGYEYNVEGLIGKSSLGVTATQVNVPQSVGLSTRWSRGDWAARVGWSHFNIDINLPPSRLALLDTIKQMCANCASVIDQRLGLKNQHVGIYTAALQWEHAGYIVSGEWARRPSSSLAVPDVEGAYLMAARRLGAWTPYVSWGRFRNTEAALGFQGPASASLAGTLADLDDARIFGRSSRVENAVGVRLDFMPRMALKAQWGQARISDPRNGSGSLIQYATPNTRFGGTVDTYTVNLDFIF